MPNQTFCSSIILQGCQTKTVKFKYYRDAKPKLLCMKSEIAEDDIEETEDVKVGTGRYNLMITKCDLKGY